MHLVDHIFILLIFVALPIYGTLDTRRYLARIEAGQPANRVRFYLETSIMQWVFLAAVGIAWWILGRSITDLGFNNLEGLALWGGTAVLVVMIGILVYSWQSTKRTSAEEKKRYVDGLGRMVHFLPHTSRDLRYFSCVSITAGVVEEIVYRGFALWYLGSFMPLWVAVFVSSIGFGLAHSYLGASGALRAGLVGLGFAIFYVLTGSVWLPIIAHIALDILQGLTAVELLRKDGTRPQNRSVFDVDPLDASSNSYDACAAQNITVFSDISRSRRRVGYDFTSTSSCRVRWILIEMEESRNTIAMPRKKIDDRRDWLGTVSSAQYFLSADISLILSLAD